jgi:hypothetical protein
MKRRYFNLNIKHPYWDKESSAADYWLRERRVAPVFFGFDSVEEVMSGVMKTSLETRQRNEMLEFLNLTKRAMVEKFDPIIVTIGSGHAWIYRPIGEPKSGDMFEFQRNGEMASDVPKYYAVEFIVDEIPVSSVPYILASMKANQAFSRGTFREIRSVAADELASYRGNIAAIQSLIGWELGFSVDPLECISSVEFETLIAKLFESNGFFVPAHRGGVLKDIDLFAHLESEAENRLLNVRKQRVLSIQLKIAVRSRSTRSQLGEWLQSSSGNYLITLESRPSAELKDFSDQGRYLTRDWIKSAVASAPFVDQWLSRSLKWVVSDSGNLTALTI